MGICIHTYHIIRENAIPFRSIGLILIFADKSVASIISVIRKIMLRDFERFIKIESRREHEFYTLHHIRNWYTFVSITVCYRRKSHHLHHSQTPPPSPATLPRPPPPPPINTPRISSQPQTGIKSFNATAPPRLPHGRRPKKPHH